MPDDKTDDKSKATDSSDGDKKGDDGKGPVPYERFKERNEIANQYEALGTPEEIAQALSDYSQLLDAVDAAEKAAAADTKKGKATSTADPKVEEKRAAIRAELEQLFPALAKLEEVFGSIEELKAGQSTSEESRVVAVQEKADAHIAAKVAELGYPAEIAPWVASIAASIVYADSNATAKMLKGDMSVVDKAFDVVKKDFLETHVAKPARPKSILPLLKGNAGVPSGKQTKETLNEEDLKKLHPQERMRKIGEDAFDFYNQVATANKEAEEAGLLGE